MFLSKLPKNLPPKFIPSSKITHRVREIIEEVIESPTKIPNYLNFDSPFINISTQRSAFNNKRVIAEYQNVDPVSLKRYLDNYHESKKSWEETPFDQKKEVFLNAADLIENKYYDTMLAYTIAGQNKTIYEAEIDAICELVDFLRFNVAYAEQIILKQPIQTSFIRNVSEYNSLNGFVASITPFNFTAIGGNLASAPLLFGNSVIWKPSQHAILSNHLFYEIMIEAGLPNGVLNFCPMEAEPFFKSVSSSNDLGALLFTGSSTVFDKMNRDIYSTVESRSVYPRVVGETGGKNFHFIDKSAIENGHSITNVAQKTVESAFNYSGQKCSACSIAYVPENMLDNFLERLKQFTKFYNDNMENYGVISEESYNRVVKIWDEISADSEVEVVEDIGNCDKENYFISPKIVICRDHENRVFNEEFFAPILAIYPYDSNTLSEKNNVMEKCCTSNNYALTGSIFSYNDEVTNMAIKKFRHKTGNFYVNDKSTGSVVGQQPFGGSGKSGTNDKAGDINLLFRLFNQRNIKINYE